MHSLPPYCYGPSGIPCVFVVDDSTGATSVGYLVRQVGTYRYVVSNGTITRVCKFARYAYQVENLNNMPPGLFTVLVSLQDGTTDNVTLLNTRTCNTIQNRVRYWNLKAPYGSVGAFTVPSSGDDLLLETGSYWLFEDGSKYELEH